MHAVNDQWLFINNSCCQAEGLTTAIKIYDCYCYSCNIDNN